MCSLPRGVTARLPDARPLPPSRRSGTSTRAFSSFRRRPSWHSSKPARSSSWRRTALLQRADSGRCTEMSRHYKWWVVAMLWLISFFNYADRQAIFSVFPLLEREMNLTPVQLGLLGSAFAWVYGLGAPFAGVIVDRVRRKTAILGGLHAWSVICMATVLSTNFRHLF